MHIAFDASTGIVRCTFRGIHTMDECRGYIADLARESATARAATGRILMLTDAREAAVQPPEVAKAYAESGNTIDRCAIIMTSTLLKMQTARVAASATVRMFADEAEALAWLTTHERAAA